MVRVGIAQTEQADANAKTSALQCRSHLGRSGGGRTPKAGLLKCARTTSQAKAAQANPLCSSRILTMPLPGLVMSIEVSLLLGRASGTWPEADGLVALIHVKAGADYDRPGAVRGYAQDLCQRERCAKIHGTISGLSNRQL